MHINFPQRLQLLISKIVFHLQTFAFPKIPIGQSLPTPRPVLPTPATDNPSDVDLKCSMSIVRNLHADLHSRTVAISKKEAWLVELVDLRDRHLAGVKHIVIGASNVLADAGLDCLLGELFDIREIARRPAVTQHTATATAAVPKGPGNNVAPHRAFTPNQQERKSDQNQQLLSDLGSDKLKGQRKRQRAVSDVDQATELKRTKAEALKDSNPAKSTHSTSSLRSVNANKAFKLIAMVNKLNAEYNAFLDKSLIDISLLQVRALFIEWDIMKWGKEAIRLLQLIEVYNLRNLAIESGNFTARTPNHNTPDGTRAAKLTNNMARPQENEYMVQRAAVPVPVGIPVNGHPVSMQRPGRRHPSAAVPGAAANAVQGGYARHLLPQHAESHYSDESYGHWNGHGMYP